MSTVLAFAILVGVFAGECVSVASDIHPLRDRPAVYVALSLLIEVAAVWLALRVLGV